MRKLYISGPMSGLPEYNRPAFFEAERQLRQAGYSCYNPAREVLPEGEDSWDDYMRLALVRLSNSYGLAMLPGWNISAGARIEYELATRLGWEVMGYSQWLDRAAERAEQAAL